MWINTITAKNIRLLMKETNKVTNIHWSSEKHGRNKAIIIVKNRRNYYDPNFREFQLFITLRYLVYISTSCSSLEIVSSINFLCPPSESIRETFCRSTFRTYHLYIKWKQKPLLQNRNESSSYRLNSSWKIPICCYSPLNFVTVQTLLGYSSPMLL